MSDNEPAEDEWITVHMTTEEYKTMVDALTNHALDCSKHAAYDRAEIPEAIRGRGAPTADVYGSYRAAARESCRLSRRFKEAFASAQPP